MNHESRRQELALGLLGMGYEQLSPVQRSVVDLIASEAPTGTGPTLSDDRTAWERLADHVALFGGSWTFIGVFALVLLLWVAGNQLAVPHAFDPYPYIFLNLVLSTLAAIQAPVILMSQNRQAARDRRAAEHDYRVNLRAELEIMRLHDRLQRSPAGPDRGRAGGHPGCVDRRRAAGLGSACPAACVRPGGQYEKIPLGELAAATRRLAWRSVAGPARFSQAWAADERACLTASPARSSGRDRRKRGCRRADRA